MVRKLILLNGMTPGGRIFKKLLPLIDNYEVVEWVDPETDISIQEYAKRIEREVGNVGECDILGVSFGGIVAQEVAPLIGAKNCFIVSSITDLDELNLLHRTLSCLPASFMNTGVSSTVGFLDSSNLLEGKSPRYKKFFGEQGEWYRWATVAVSSWEPSGVNRDSWIRIHGDADETFKKGHLYSDYVISGATHVLALSHAEELAKIIKKYR